MKERVKISAQKILTTYLQRENCRKTPERFAILDVVCEMNGPFSIDELNAMLETTKQFYVSRSTLYNTLHLLLDLKLLVQYRIKNKTCYLVSLSGNNHSRMVCTECGKVIEIKSLKMNDVFSDIRVRGFRKENYELNIFGICSACRKKKDQKDCEKSEKAKKDNRNQTINKTKQ